VAVSELPLPKWQRKTSLARVLHARASTERKGRAAAELRTR